MSQTQTQTVTTQTCDVCYAEIELGPDTILHELMECIDCGTEYEVTSLDPIMLEEAPMEAEDWGQ